MKRVRRFFAFVGAIQLAVIGAATAWEFKQRWQDSKIDRQFARRLRDRRGPYEH